MCILILVKYSPWPFQSPPAYPWDHKFQYNLYVLVLSPPMMLKLQWLAVIGSKFISLYAYFGSNLEKYVVIYYAGSLICWYWSLIWGKCEVISSLNPSFELCNIAITDSHRWLPRFFDCEQYRANIQYLRSRYNYIVQFFQIFLWAAFPLCFTD